jgi:hypothetical protein
MLCNTRSVARIKNSKKSLGPKRNHPEDGIPSVSNSAHCIKARLQRYHADGEDDTGLRPLGLIGEIHRYPDSAGDELDFFATPGGGLQSGIERHKLRLMLSCQAYQVSVGNLFAPQNSLEHPDRSPIRGGAE